MASPVNTTSLSLSPSATSPSIASTMFTASDSASRSSFTSIFNASASATASVSASASSASSAGIPLPSGCVDSPGAQLRGNYRGCRGTDIALTAQCCLSVGSTITYANESCGCPFTGAYQYNSTLMKDFSQCAVTGGAVLCIGPPGPDSGAGVKSGGGRWAMVLVGMLLVGSVGCGL